MMTLHSNFWRVITFVFFLLLGLFVSSAWATNNKFCDNTVIGGFCASCAGCTVAGQPALPSCNVYPAYNCTSPGSCTGVSTGGPCTCPGNAGSC